MKTKLGIFGLIGAISVSLALSKTCARGDDFNAVVKIIEQFYHVKHQSIPLIARAAMKTTRTVARIEVWLAESPPFVKAASRVPIGWLVVGGG